MIKGEFYTFVNIDGENVAVKKSGYLDNEHGIGYYSYDVGCDTKRWCAVDLLSGHGAGNGGLRKAAERRLNENWDRLVLKRKSVEYKEVCDKFAAAITKAEQAAQAGKGEAE